MPNTNPTIVSASLSDKELQDSINKMVANFDKGLQTMLEHSNEYVGKIQASLEKIGNTNFGAKGSNDGGVAKRTKAQEEYTESVKKTTAETKRMGKETEMTFDQIATALSQARRTVSDFNTKRASGMLPSSEDYKKYEQALARIVEYNDKLKQSALGMADANQKAFAFDGKGLVKDFFSVDERLKQLNQHYKEEEKSSQKATAAIKENTQAKKENANVGQPAKSARDSYIAFMQGYKQQAEQIRSLMEEEQKAMQQRRQGVVDGFTKAIEERKARVKELSEEVAKLYKERPDGYRDTIKQRTEEMNALKQKIKELTEAQKNLADSPIGASSRFLELEKEYNRIKNIMIDTTNAQRQSTQETEKQAQAQKQVTQGAKEYSEQVQKIAAEVRASAKWQQTDKLGFRRGTANIDGRSMPVVENLQMGLVLEEQIEQAIQRVNAERQKGVTITQQQSEAERKAAELLGWTETQQKKRYVAPITNIEQISAVRGALEAITGQQEKWVDEINKTKASYNELSRYVKELKGVYLDMERGGNTNAAKALAQEIQTTERAMQKFVQTMSRPVSLKDALGGSEKTLDDIAYKMQRLRSYKQGIDLTKPNAANEIKQVDEALARLRKDADKWMSKSQDLIKNNTALGRSWNYMKNRLAFYFTVGASTQFVKNLIEVRSQYEMNERALGILIDSAERGTQIFNELSQMALVSPYTLIELSAAAKQLTAYDVAAKDVVDTTRRLADMAAAVGIPIERLTYALGQIKAYGYLNSRDARMFANAGIPLVKQLSDYYTELEGRLVSTADIYDRIKKKAIDYNEVMEVINKMTDEGGKFFDFQAKMADTLKVRLANLTLAWNNMLNDMGKESQGVLTWGIGALRDLFLQWKQLNNLIENAALAVGVRTLLVALRAATIGLGSFGKAMTWNAILGKKLGGVVVGLAKSFGTLFSSRLTWFALLAIAAVEATQALFGVNEAQKALNESIRNGAKDNYDNISKFIEQYKEVRDSLYKTVTKPVPNGMLNVIERTDSQGNKWHSISREYTETLPQDIDKNEAKKAWEAIREQIELTVASSDKYIGNLLSISNMSERVRQGFNLLDDIQVVNAALKELDDGTIKVSQDFSAWWNVWQAPDGLIENLKDYQDALDDVIAEYGTMESFRENTFIGGKGSHDLNNYETALERFRDDLQKTTDSIINFIELKGWSGDESKINQVFEQITQKLVLDNQLDPQKAFTLQTEVEEARSKAAKEALLQRINDEKAAYKISHDESVRQALNADIERYNSWNETNGRSKVEWERFTKWLKEQHISETTAMFRNMDAEDIKSLNFQEGKHAEWVTRMVTQYAEEHKMSIDDVEGYLKNFVRNANQMSIFIPLIISTEDKKSVYDQLGEYDKAVDEADAQIERLTKRIGELNAKKKKSKEETQELANAEQELADAQKAKADAEAKGGHGKKEKKDEKSANKAAKQAESELAKALKDELSTIDKVRSIYKDLTKEGRSHADAVERATEGWDETVNAINKVLQKNGLQKLDLTKFAGITNPRELVDMLQSQLDILVKRGAKAEEIKELQTKIQTLNVDADKYDLTRITKGLNNELDKLKDEYELAVELDANPELGGEFADMFGINMETLPRTAKEYAERATKELNKYLSKKESDIKIGNLLYLTDDALRMFQERVETDGLSQEWVDNIIKAAKDVRDAWKKETSDTIKNWNSLVEKYGEIQAKITKINKDSSAQRKDIVMQYGSDEQKSLVTRLYDNLSKEQNPQEIEKLRKQIEDIVSKISEKNPIALKIQVAIGNAEKRQISQALWEDFKNGDLYTSTFEDMERVSTFTIKRILDELERLKNKVKDDPASMKALMKSMDDARKKLQERNPFKTLLESIKKLEGKRTAVKNAKTALDNAKKALDNAKEQDNQEEVQRNIKKVEEAEKVLSQTSDELTASLQELKKAQEGVSAAMQSLAGIISTTSDIAKALGGSDDSVETLNDLAESINGVTEAAEGITDIVTGAESGNILTIIQGAQKTIDGTWKTIDTWLDNSDKRRTRSIERSQMAIKHLELAYIDLQHAVDKAYGMATIGAQKAAIANKELQLVELKRQLALEQGRKKKYRDNARIVELQQQIKELQYEIQDATDSIVNDLLGISSVGDAMENLMDGLIDALRSGEDAMAVFDENIDNMIANMMKKMYVTKVLQPWFENVWEQIQKDIDKRGGDAAKLAQEQLSLDDNQLRTQMANQRVFDFFEKSRREGYTGYFPSFQTMRNFFAKGITDEDLKAFRKDAQRRLTEATSPTMEDLMNYAELLREGRPVIENGITGLNEALKQLGLNEESLELSSLQQGIQGITEDTAGALEAITSGMSQQIYLHSDLLTQIRDAIVGFDMDVQTATMGEILLQLRSSYEVQMAIHGILEGVLTPSGRAFSVELMS